jgi:P-type Mg2+ transporter
MERTLSLRSIGACVDERPGFGQEPAVSGEGRRILNARHHNDALPDSYWGLDQAALLSRLQSSSGGLSSAAAEEKLRLFGPNEPAVARRWSPVLLYLGRFTNPLVMILLVASAISAVTGDLASFLIIAVLVVLSVTLDFVQEVRAERAAEALSRSVALRASVLRDGTVQEIHAIDLVPGDVVLLSAGDLVPADGVLLEAKDLFLNQAILTGESFPAEKSTSLSSPSAGPGEAANAAFLGTSVISGTGRLLVCRTGRGTALGRIAHVLGHKPPPTAFEIGIRSFGMMILRWTVLLVLFVIMVNVLLQRPLIESFLFAIALAVGLTPELLPMVTTVTLARGAMRLSRRRVIVKRLSALHNLGAMDVLCTDKTGTLTEARVVVARTVDVEGRSSRRALELAWLNSHFETGLRSPLDEALLASTSLDPGPWSKVDEVPFDFERRRVSTLLARDGELVLIVKGAPEHVLAVSTHFEAGDGRVCDLDEAIRNRLRELFDELCDQGLRALAVAYRSESPGHRSAVLKDEAELVFVGYVAFMDPPKPGAAEAMARLRSSGIAVKILTGDNEHVTRHLCAALGLTELTALSGEELSRLSDEALRARLSATTLFCRLSPQQKMRVITTLKRTGHTVGFLGDGINDAPALQAADVGISVDSAADVAREAADLILLDHDLMPVHEGVIEGRRAFENIFKYVLMGTSSNFGNMFSMAAAAVFLPFLPMKPAQVLLNNLLYDLSETTIPLDRVDADAVARPERWDISVIRRFMLVVGPVSTVFDLLTFFLLIRLFHADEALFQTSWFVETLVTQTLAVFIIRTRGSALASQPHRVLAGGAALIAAVAIGLPYTALGSLLGFVPLPWDLLLALGVVACGYLVAAEFVKRLFWKHLLRTQLRTQPFP